MKLIAQLTIRMSPEDERGFLQQDEKGTKVKNIS